VLGLEYYKKKSFDRIYALSRCIAYLSQRIKKTYKEMTDCKEYIEVNFEKLSNASYKFLKFVDQIPSHINSDDLEQNADNFENDSISIDLISAILKNDLGLDSQSNILDLFKAC